VSTRGLHRPKAGHWPDPAQGLGLDLVAQIMSGSGRGLGLVQMTAIKHYFEHFGLSQVIIFFTKKNLFVVTLMLCP
jgi:hypothetical protein